MVDEDDVYNLEPIEDLLEGKLPFTVAYEDDLGRDKSPGKPRTTGKSHEAGKKGRKGKKSHHQGRRRRG